MSDASLKRSRQEPGHPMVHHPRNHNILEDKEDLLVARMPKKGMKENADKDDEALEIVRLNTFARRPYILACDEPGYLYASEIKLHNLEYGMINEEPVLENNDQYLIITPASFRPSVIVEIPPLPESTNYQVGWIQVCTFMDYIFNYGRHGIGSYEIPELVSGKYTMVNAGDGTLFPWIGSTTEVAHIIGPTLEPTFAPISMISTPSVNIPWTSINSRDPNLTYVYKKQRFYTFLALKDVNTNICQIIETITWVSDFAVDVNPNAPFGQRSKLLAPLGPKIPPRIAPLYLLPHMDAKAINPPNAGFLSAQVWRPSNGSQTLATRNMHCETRSLKTREATYMLAIVSRMKYV